LSRKTTKLALAYSYVMLIADTPNLSGFGLELPRQLEGLGTSQFLYVIDFSGPLKNSTN